MPLAHQCSACRWRISALRYTRRMLLRIFAVLGYTTCSGCNATADRARLYICCAEYSAERKTACMRLQMMAILGCVVVTVIAIIIVVIVKNTGG
jgi:hypothetical protein